jgi:hypothetical protein
MMIRILWSFSLSGAAVIAGIHLLSSSRKVDLHSLHRTAEANVMNEAEEPYTTWYSCACIIANTMPVITTAFTVGVSYAG